MEKGSLLACLLAALSVSNVYAVDLAPDGIAMGYGKYLHKRADLSAYRGSLLWDWNQDWLSSKSWKLTGYFDLSLNYWKSHLGQSDQPSPDGAGKIWALSFSPVFRLESEISPVFDVFFDAGIGLSYQTKKDIEKKLKSPINMGGHSQFEIRTLAGVRFGDYRQFELSYGWFHYSNAHIHSENEGLDFQLIRFGYWFY